MALRARIVLMGRRGTSPKDIAGLADVSARTGDRTKTWYMEEGIAGPMEKKRRGRKAQAPPRTRGHVIALTRMTPPAKTVLRHGAAHPRLRAARHHEPVRRSEHFHG
ncbi:helix-turn-helix domain-containing protein [Streptomyces sp. KLMMK]|uniref:helix-turn-helix domain-containing protein n=1 Tax=Streptomyces sp. KLMMK TaxID=3109353 RepID=UPI003FA6FDA0